MNATKAKIRLGMIGGGEGSFIGAVHRIAARIDNEYELVCGAFSSNAEKSLQSGLGLQIDADRCYASFQEMIEKEATLPTEKRMQVVSIVTPNHVHFEPAMLALENGFHVILDKPMTFTLAEAKLLSEKIRETGLLFCLTHTYTGYPMVKQAREIVKSGTLGGIRKIYVEYPQGWLSTFLEQSGHTQASWRTDPARSGIAGSMGDIGTHAFNLAEYVSGLHVTALCADLNIVVQGRKLDDDGAVLLRFNNGATGVLMATQIAAGEENNIKLRVYGERGSIEWKHEDANSLLVKWTDQPAQIYRTGAAYNSSLSNDNTRVPPGHPEGYLEAFANLYRNFANCVQAKMNGKEPEAAWLDFPGAEEGLRGMAFVEAAVASSAAAEKWYELKV